MEVWVHRALLADKRRTTDPEAASLFFVPAYLSLSKSSDAPGHDERLTNLIEELRNSKWFQRNRGADHVFGYSSINPGVARQLLFPKLHTGLERSYFGVFEMNPAWVGGDRKEATLQRMVPAPYVVDASRLAGTSAQIHDHSISVFFAAHRRPNAAQWSGCDRSKALGLESVPRSSIHIKSHRRRFLLDEDAFAHSMRVADFCLVMCGDTPTSRRIFDAIVAEALGGYEGVTENLEKFAEGVFVQALTWSVGASVDFAGRDRFDAYLRLLLSAVFCNRCGLGGLSVASRLLQPTEGGV